MRAGGVFFNYDATWFQDLQQEMLRFPRDVHDDMVDSLAWIGLTLDKQHEGLTPREKEDEDWEDLVSAFPTYEGQSAVTGY